MFLTIDTLGDLHRAPGWLWLNCVRQGCGHHKAVAIAPFVIRWGPSTSVEVLKRNAACERCGGRGAGFTVPSWVDMIVGEQPFPSEEIVRAEAERLRAAEARLPASARPRR